MKKVEPKILDQYKALTEGFGFVKLNGCSLITFRGNDRVRFLHNFCTADIKKLGELETCEAFFLNPKGKTIGHGFIINLVDQLMVWMIDSSGESLVEFLDRYLLSEDVQIKVESDQWSSLFACGSSANNAICNLFTPESDSKAAQNENGIVTKAEIAGEGFLIVSEQEKVDRLIEKMTEAGGVRSELEALHCLRLECKTPWLGVEISDSNLPQEFCRDEKAISFEKGCYLGQETVARLDAMGHVNQKLVTFRLKPKSQLTAGQEIEVDGKVVAKLTSVAWSPKQQTLIAIGFARSKFCKTGTELVARDEIVTVA